MCRATYPYSSHLFIFHGKNASLLKILGWDEAAPIHQAHRPPKFFLAALGGA
jgi:hypothetical protein